jgi:hypothetical protein
MKWFYTLKNHVKGPFSNEEFETALASLGTDIKETLVWTRGKADWTEADRWSVADADKIQAQVQTAAVMSSLANVKVEPTTTVEVPAAEKHPPIPFSSDVKPPAQVQKKESPSLKTTPLPPKIKSAKSAAPVASPNPEPVAKPKPASTPLILKEEKNPRQNTSVTAISTQPAPIAKPTAPVPDVILPTDEEITKLLGAAPAEIIKSVVETLDEKYKVQYNGAEQAPMTKSQLIEFIARQEDPSLVLIYNKKQDDWKEIYTFPDIVEKLGLSRRQNRRVTLLANFKGKINQSTEMNARLTTISLGGFGLTDVFDLKVGDSVKGQISSPHFYTPIAIEGEVTYAGAHGGIGLKFTSITDEARALVVDYIKKFGQGVKTEEI